MMLTGVADGCGGAVAVMPQICVRVLVLELWTHCVHRCGAGHTGCWLVCVRALALCPGKGPNGTETMFGVHVAGACDAGVTAGACAVAGMGGDARCFEVR